MISITSDPTLSYPDQEDLYSPDVRFPEYRYVPVSSWKNRVYRAVRDCLVQASLDRECLGQVTWNPLGNFIKPGSRVFVLCNFVFHRVPGESVEDFTAKCIQESILRAPLDYLLLSNRPFGYGICLS
jgi:hypothetical protein